MLFKGGVGASVLRCPAHLPRPSTDAAFWLLEPVRRGPSKMPNTGPAVKVMRVCTAFWPASGRGGGIVSLLQALVSHARACECSLAAAALSTHVRMGGWMGPPACPSADEAGAYVRSNRAGRPLPSPSVHLLLRQAGTMMPYTASRTRVSSYIRPTVVCVQRLHIPMLPCIYHT